MTEDRLKSYLSSAHYEAIGQVIVACSALQQILSIGAVNLAIDDPPNFNPHVSVLTTGMSAQTLIGVWRTLARLRELDDVDAFDKLADQIQKIYRQRDIFAHCIFVPGKKPDTLIPQQVKTVGSLRKTQDLEYTADDIKAWAAVAADQMVKLVAFLAHWGIAPPPWRGTPSAPTRASRSQPRRPGRKKGDPAPKRRKRQRQP